MAKENESRSVKDEVSKSIDQLTATQNQKRSKRDKRTYIFNGGLAGLFVVLSILSVVFGNGETIVYNLIALMWLAMVTFLKLENSHLLWVMGMQRGLHELERAEFDKLIDSLAPEKIIKEAKEKAHARTNA